MKKQVGINTFTLALMNVAAVASLRGLPSNAELGLSLVFFLAIGAVLFVIPMSLVSAELATGWRGGVFLWVGAAFGKRWGFVAIWLQWIQNVIWYPTVLSFAAGALAFAIDPALAESGAFTAIIVLVVYWGATLLAFRGLNLSGLLGSWGVVLGTVIPGVLIIVLAALYLFQGNPSAIPLRTADLLPREGLGLSTLVYSVGMLLAYAGMEMNAVHANEMRDPGRNYPRSILAAVLMILVLFILGSLAVAVVVPKEQISLTAGIMEAYEIFLARFGLQWAVPGLALVLTVGVFAGVITWIAGPSKGLLHVGRQGFLPPWMQHTNRHGVQTRILVLQGGIVTLLALGFVLIPNVGSSYWILVAMTIQLYLVMYVLMFAAAIRLRITHPAIARPYRVPAIFLWAGLGLLVSIAAILLGFEPPTQWAGGRPGYAGILLCGILLLGIGPFLFYRYRKPGWRTDGSGTKHTAGDN
jgi:putative glutamate/gamma-aminobutyrate antiporter